VVVVVCYAATFRVVFLSVFWFWVVFYLRLGCGVWRFFSLVCMARCRFWLLVGVMHVEYIFGFTSLIIEWIGEAKDFIFVMPKLRA